MTWTTTRPHTILDLNQLITSTSNVLKINDLTISPSSPPLYHLTDEPNHLTTSTSHDPKYLRTSTSDDPKYLTTSTSHDPKYLPTSLSPWPKHFTHSHTTHYFHDASRTHLTNLLFPWPERFTYSPSPWPKLLTYSLSPRPHRTHTHTTWFLIHLTSRLSPHHKPFSQPHHLHILNQFTTQKSFNNLKHHHNPNDLYTLNHLHTLKRSPIHHLHNLTISRFEPLHN